MKITDILFKSQQELKSYLAAQLSLSGCKIISKDGFLLGIPPVARYSRRLLAAHLDTVHLKLPKVIYRDSNKNILTSPQGIGGDDRCGVYMILKIIKSSPCAVLFCEDEEAGGLGAYKFVESKIKPDTDFIIELDRRGANDAVFYDCCNPEFITFIESFGFKEAYGSFSDISILAPYLGVAAVNISSGYYNEHSKEEYINLNVVRSNIRRVSKIIKAASGRFEYVAAEPPPESRGCGGGKRFEDVSPYFGGYKTLRPTGVSLRGGKKDRTVK